MSFLVCSQSIFAQLEKGMKSIGLSSGFNYNKSFNNENATINSEETERTISSYNYGISPTINYFLSSKFSVGLSIGYTGSVINNNAKYSSSYFNTFDLTNHTKIQNSYFKGVSNGINISPNATYYIPLSDQFFFFLRGGIGSSFSQSKSTGTSNFTDYNTTNNAIYTNSIENTPNKVYIFNFNVGISPGILFMPTKKIGLEFSIGNLISYNHFQNNQPSKSFSITNNGFQFLNINSMSVGTAIYYYF